VDRPYASITFLTHDDLEAGARFYGDTLGLPLIEGHGWAKVHRISEGACIGLVSSRGAGTEGPVGGGVLLSIAVDDVDAWYDRLRDEPRIEITSKPAMVPGIPVYSFFLRDPAGYRVEIQAFTDPETSHRFRNAG